MEVIGCCYRYPLYRVTTDYSSEQFLFSSQAHSRLILHTKCPNLKISIPLNITNTPNV